LTAYSGIVGATPAQALAEYSVAKYGSPFEAAAAALGDFAFACASRDVSKLLVAAGVTTYPYEFDDPAAGPLGATHGAEISYLMDDGAGAGIGWQSTGASLTLSQDMRTYWAQFAKTGNPNTTGVPTWAPYSVSGDNVQYLVPTGPTQDSALAVRHNCAFWGG
jgi:para-nitrobenzyl esterase